MCIWFCETFCCFLLRFKHGLRRGNDDADLEPGESIYALPNLRPPHQPNTQSSQAAPIALNPIYPGGPASTSSSSPARSAPRSVPLPVNYPLNQTPTGKHFKINKPKPNRMKPLPPLRTTFDGGGNGGAPGDSGDAEMYSSVVEKGVTSTSMPTSRATDLTYGESAATTTVAASGPSGKGRLPWLDKPDKPFHVEVSPLPMNLFQSSLATHGQVVETVQEQRNKRFLMILLYFPSGEKISATSMMLNTYTATTRSPRRSGGGGGFSPAWKPVAEGSGSDERVGLRK
ncbi:MAG: hypothetical protein Q9183_000749 [Haloplaca sp. 2 TL-2023]